MLTMLEIDMSNIRGQVNRLFDELGRRRTESAFDEGAFAPPVDIIEVEDALLINVELPGVSKDAIEINVENSTLFLGGLKARSPEFKDDSYRRSERQFGRFSRSFTLPRTVDANAIEATFQDGVLRLRLPRARSAMPRKIAIG
jgi:HSP20 family protein